jgi:predicted AAA+ superfamily ATPase
MRILRLVRPHGGGAKLVRGEPKLMFYHPVMRSAVCNALQIKPDKGAVREELAVFCFNQRGWKVNTIKGMKRSPDYVIEKRGEQLVVEIGGPSKKRTQLKEFEDKSIVITDLQLMALACF